MLGDRIGTAKPQVAAASAVEALDVFVFRRVTIDPPVVPDHSALEIPLSVYPTLTVDPIIAVSPCMFNDAPSSKSTPCTNLAPVIMQDCTDSQRETLITLVSCPGALFLSNPFKCGNDCIIPESSESDVSQNPRTAVVNIAPEQPRSPLVLIRQPSLLTAICSICQQEFEDGDLLKRLPCFTKHVFHQGMCN